MKNKTEISIKNVMKVFSDIRRTYWSLGAFSEISKNILLIPPLLDFFHVIYFYTLSSHPVQKFIL
jgi:hypothetical protein